MSIENKYWTGEPIKMTLYIDDDVYTSQTNVVTREKFIQSLSFTRSEGNTSVNPLGITSSNKVTINCFDINDNLSPANNQGAYAGRLTNGLKLKLEISKDGGNTWLPYGTYYTTSFSGSFSDGMHSIVTISCEDKVNILGNTLVPELDVYANISIGKLIPKLFTALGYNENQYYIDPKLNTNILWGVLPGTKIRDFINSVCQRMFARFIIDNNEVMKFIPALELPTEYETLVLGANDIGSLSNSSQSSINYSSIGVTYYIAGEDKEVELYNKKDIALNLGHNQLNNIAFENEAICVNYVDVAYEGSSGLGKITNVNYVAFQNGMALILDVEDSAVYNVELTVRGIVSSQLKNTVKIDMNTGGREGLIEYNFDVKSSMEEDEALELCNSIADYITKFKNQIKISGTILTPFLNTGDCIKIENTLTMYDGTYKILNINIDYNESYKTDLTLIRID